MGEVVVIDAALSLVVSKNHEFARTDRIRFDFVQSLSEAGPGKNSFAPTAFVLGSAHVHPGHHRGPDA